MSIRFCLEPGCGSDWGHGAAHCFVGRLELPLQLLLGMGEIGPAAAQIAWIGALGAQIGAWVVEADRRE